MIKTVTLPYAELQELRDALAARCGTNAQEWPMIFAIDAQLSQVDDIALEAETGEPHIDGWPLYRGIPKSKDLKNE
jgi:hypothetical protein